MRKLDKFIGIVLLLLLVATFTFVDTPTYTPAHGVLQVDDYLLESCEATSITDTNDTVLVRCEVSINPDI